MKEFVVIQFYDHCVLALVFLLQFFQCRFYRSCLTQWIYLLGAVAIFQIFPLFAALSEVILVSKDIKKGSPGLT